jgi:hypothetical protein
MGSLQPYRLDDLVGFGILLNTAMCMPATHLKFNQGTAPCDSLQVGQAVSICSKL